MSRTLKPETIFRDWELFKNDENAFYFTLKALLVLKIFKFLSWIFVHVEKRLDQNDKFNFKIYEVTAGKQTIAIHILTNISRSKGNQAMKFG